MSLPFIYRSDAEAEFLGAIEWYESRQPGIGLRFEAAVRVVIEEITTNPRRFPLEYRDVRQAPVPDFPFCIYYRVRPKRLVILSVFHSSRDPSNWQSRA